MLDCYICGLISSVCVMESTGTLILFIASSTAFRLALSQENISTLG